jgi:predicted transcriptional regulator
MLRNNISKIQRISKNVIITLFSISMLLLLTMPVHADQIPQSNFAAEVLLNKPGVTYDLSPLEEFAELGLVEIKDIEEDGKYYIYKSHYNSDVAVIIRKVNDKMYYPPGPNYTEKELSGLSVILVIPTEWEESIIDHEVAQLKFDFELNLIQELISFMESQNFENEESGNIEINGKYANLEFSKEDTTIILSSGEGGKTDDGITTVGESIIWARGPKTSYEENLNQDIKNMLVFLQIDPNEWAKADRKTESNSIMIEVPTVNIDSQKFDWSAAMHTELEWLISQSIIANLKESDKQDITMNTKAGYEGYNYRLIYENGSWKSFSETDAIKQIFLPMDDSISTKFDLSDTLNNLKSWTDDEDIPGKPEVLPYFLISIISAVLFILVIGTFSYSRLKRKSILDNLNRKNIYENIKANPGIHYMELQRELDIPQGVLAYHLNVLEKREYIKSMQDSKYRRFYLSGVKSDLKMVLTSVQMRILNVVNNHPGISQTKISENIGKNRMLVNYHIRILTDAGILALEKSGRESQCYTTSTTAYYITE